MPRVKVLACVYLLYVIMTEQALLIWYYGGTPNREASFGSHQLEGTKASVSVWREFRNTLGLAKDVALPAGKLRVYQSEYLSM